MLYFENENIAIFFSLESDGDMLFTTRTDTDLARTYTDEKNRKVRANRISFFKKHDIDPKRLVNLAGAHGTKIETITRDSILGSGALDPNTGISNTDGLITNIKNSYLMVTGADCFPVFFYDSEKRVIGVAHCGWRGIIGYADLHKPNTDQHRQKHPTKGIAEEMMYYLKNEFGSSPADIQVWIGPGIKRCHFSKSEDVVELFIKEYASFIKGRDTQHATGHFIDLAGVIKHQLVRVGLNPKKIIEHPDCTFCEKDKYFSYRRDKLTNPERVEGPKIIEANACIIHLK